MIGDVTVGVRAAGLGLMRSQLYAATQHNSPKLESSGWRLAW